MKKVTVTYVNHENDQKIIFKFSESETAGSMKVEMELEPEANDKTKNDIFGVSNALLDCLMDPENF